MLRHDTEDIRLPMKTGQHIRGFTLLELIVVMVVLGVLAVVLTPRINDMFTEATSAKFAAEEERVNMALTKYAAKSAVTGGGAGSFPDKATMRQEIFDPDGTKETVCGFTARYTGLKNEVLDWDTCQQDQQVWQTACCPLGDSSCTDACPACEACNTTYDGCNNLRSGQSYTGCCFGWLYNVTAGKFWANNARYNQIACNIPPP